RQLSHPHSQQPDAPRKIDTLEPQPGVTTNSGGIGRVLLHRRIARHSLEVVETQLDADGAADIALALQVPRHLLAQAGEDLAELGAVMHHMQLAIGRASWREGLEK